MRIQEKPVLLVLSLLDSAVHNASVKCDRMRSQKIRRRPESCHAYHPQVSFSLVHSINEPWHQPAFAATAKQHFDLNAVIFFIT